MNPEVLHSYCMDKPGVTQDMPFDSSTVAYRVGGKIYALTSYDVYDFINLKCDPERAVELRELHEGIRPGYHMSKKHWNSVYLDGAVNDRLIKELIDHSYELVFHSLSKKLQAEITATQP